MLDSLFCTKLKREHAFRFNQLTDDHANHSQEAYDHYIEPRAERSLLPSFEPKVSKENTSNPPNAKWKYLAPPPSQKKKKNPQFHGDSITS